MPLKPLLSGHCVPGEMPMWTHSASQGAGILPSSITKILVVLLRTPEAGMPFSLESL